ncbi:4385_t:CDS:2 [Gigaspora rosea]|nr:4385_t:CDS:2 [Gigaspora rosea]
MFIIYQISIDVNIELTIMKNKEDKKRIMEESMKVNNTRTLHQIVEDVLKETVRDILQIDLNEIIKLLCLTPEPYLYQIPEPDEHFEYVVVENDSSQKVGDKMEYPEVVRRLVKYDNKVDGDEVDEDKVDEDDVDEDELSKIKDSLTKKSAEKWVKGYIKNLHEGPKKDETIISHLWKEARTYAKNLYDTAYADKIVK